MLSNTRGLGAVRLVALCIRACCSLKGVVKLGRLSDADCLTHLRLVQMDQVYCRIVLGAIGQVVLHRLPYKFVFGAISHVFLHICACCNWTDCLTCETTKLPCLAHLAGRGFELACGGELLGRVCEESSDESIDEFIVNHCFEPLPIFLM